MPSALNPAMMGPDAKRRHWGASGVPGDSLEHAIEAVERYGAEVIGRPS